MAAAGSEQDILDLDPLSTATNHNGGAMHFGTDGMLYIDVGENAKNKLGPPLNGIDGRKAGTVADYNYNEGIKNSGITWSDETFKEYIKDPRTKIPDTKMFFVGIKDEKEIGDLWAYLKQFSADGAKK